MKKSEGRREIDYWNNKQGMSSSLKKLLKKAKKKVQFGNNLGFQTDLRYNCLMTIR